MNFQFAENAFGVLITFVTLVLVIVEANRDCNSPLTDSITMDVIQGEFMHEVCFYQVDSENVNSRTIKRLLNKVQLLTQEQENLKRIVDDLKHLRNGRPSTRRRRARKRRSS